MKRIFFSIFLKLFVITTNLYAIQSMSGIPKTTKEIEFTLEVLDGVNVEPLWLDFGNILKNSNNLYTAQSYLNIEGKFQEESYISTFFDEGVKEENYTKLEVGLEENQNITNDKIDVYIKNVENQIIKQGDTKIPIIGEIRSVGDIKLGRYSKNVRMNVIITPISPIK